ncbi:MAG: phosphoribosylformylglycinamidine synthase [Caulobacteraceae bacterium]|nr:phosphoribosylformylglycinamidine synthase [Caulobacteraceae bacterium]
MAGGDPGRGDQGADEVAVLALQGQIVGAIEGMAEACRALDFPVVSGNVSLYNETNGAAIPPTPTVGAVGLIADYAHRADFSGLKDGDTLVLIGDSRGELGASLYLRELLGREDGAPPPVDLAAERRNGDFVRGLIRVDAVTAVHDLSDGGLACAAAEMALASDIGVTLTATSNSHAHPFLFGEDQARYLVATRDPRDLLAQARAAGVHAIVAGEVGGEAFASRELFSIPMATLRAAHEGWLPRFMGGAAATA